jgi:hypothetical protein
MEQRGVAIAIRHFDDHVGLGDGLVGGHGGSGGNGARAERQCCESATGQAGISGPVEWQNVVWHGVLPDLGVDC